MICIEQAKHECPNSDSGLNMLCFFNELRKLFVTSTFLKINCRHGYMFTLALAGQCLVQNLFTFS